MGTATDGSAPPSSRRISEWPATGSDIRLLEALDEIGRLAIATSDLTEIARRATASIKSALGLAYVALVLVDHGRGVVRQLADAGDLGQHLEAGFSLPLDRGLVGRCVRESTTIYVEDVREDADYVETIPGIVTALVVPVVAEGVIIALLVCESRKPRSLRDRVVLMEIVAHRLGVAFENADLFRDHELALERVRRQAAELEALNEIARISTESMELRPTLQAITDTLSRRFDWDFVACVTIDPQRSRFLCEALTSRLPTSVHVGYGRPLGTGVVGHVAATGVALVIDDVRRHDNYVETLPGALSEICVPVMYRGQLVAIINAESTAVATFADQLSLLETVAEQVAATIANARLYEQLKRRAAELEILSEASRIASDADDPRAVLDRVVGYVRERLQLPLVAVLLLDERAPELELASFSSAVPIRVARGARVSSKGGVLGRALATGEPQLVLDVRADPDYLAVSDAIVAEYAVPIRSGDRLLGVADFNATDPGTFGAETVVALGTLVEQVSGAIRLATINRRLREANGVLTELFSRYVAPDLVEALLADPERFRSRGERRNASVLFADIRRFTSLSQRLDSERVLALLNEYYEAMGEAIFAHRGSVNKILGDGLMAVFGVPERLEDHADAAVRAALDMQRAARRLSPRWEAVAGEPLDMVVVVNSGEVVAGSLGDPRHMEFTVLGDTVNVSARLEAEAKSRGVSILVTAQVIAALGTPVACEPLGSVELRGRDGPVEIFRVLPRPPSRSDA